MATRTPASSSASSAPAPPSVVADPPTVTITCSAPASTAATISSPVPRVEAAQRVALALVDETQAARLGRLHDRRAVGQEREARLDRTPERIGRRDRADLAAERGHKHLHRPLAAVGNGQLVRLAVGGAQARGDRGGHLAR